MSITIKEIADRANTSIATVSRVINNSEKVAPETRKKILDIIKEYDYRKNQFAGGLVSGRSQMIALVTPDEEDYCDSYYFKKLFYGINRAANEKGYNIIINPQHGTKSRFPVDGYMFISPAIDSPLVKKLETGNTPLVLVNHKSDRVNWVDIDNISAITDIVNHLTKLGHRHIGIITGGDNIQNSIERLRGYKEILSKKSIKFNPDYVIDGAFAEKKAYEEVNKLVSKNLPVTALVACNDLMAVGAIRAIKDNNMRVPEDIAVIGFDDIDGICFFNPAITTFRQPFFDMGFAAVNILVDRIEGETDALINKEFNGELVLRESCGAQLAGMLYE